MDMLVKSESLTSVADAIREKGGTNEQLVFPDGFATAIMAIQSGVSGATLTVTTPAEGVVVTVAKGEQTHTKTSGADKTAIFTGLGTGTWTITISDGTHTATGTIDIDADYASELTFFAATINVTYKAGLVCTVSDGVTTLTAPDTSGTWACIVPNVGTWTVSVSGVNSTWSVSITANGQSKTVDATKVYLFKSGEGALVTLKYDEESEASITASKTSIVTDYSSTQSNFCIQITNGSKISTATHTKLCVEITHRSIARDDYPLYIVLTDTYVDMAVSELTKFDAYKRIETSTSKKTHYLPLDGYQTGSYHLGLWGSADATIYNIWLE